MMHVTADVELNKKTNPIPQFKWSSIKHDRFSDLQWALSYGRINWMKQVAAHCDWYKKLIFQLACARENWGEDSWLAECGSSLRARCRLIGWGVTCMHVHRARAHIKIPKSTVITDAFSIKTLGGSIASSSVCVSWNLSRSVHDFVRSTWTYLQCQLWVTNFYAISYLDA